MASRPLGEQQLRRLLEVGRALVSELDLESVLHHVLEVARELTGARYAALGILDERKEELERFLYVGIDEQMRREIGPLPRGRGILGELIRNPRPLRLADVSGHPRSYGFPPVHAPMKTFLGVPILIRGEAWGNLYLTEKAGGAEFDEHDEESVVTLADWAAIAIDNARLYERVQERRHELERAVSGLEATTAIARALGGETNLGTVLDLIVKRGRAFVAAGWAAIMIKEGEELVVAAAAGALPRDPTGLRLPIEGSVAGRVVGSMVPERIAEMSDSAVLLRPDGVGLRASSAMFIPLVFRGRAAGVLLTADKLTGDGAFGEEDERLMLSFAASAATAIATAQSVEADRLHHSIESAEQERRRWARELHDETLQELGALGVMLDTALRSGSPEALERSARQVLAQVEHMIDDLQSLITELRPAALDDLGVQPAIEALVERTRAMSDLELSLEVDLRAEPGRPRERLAPQLESTIYRLVQEALTNAVKHAGAQRVAVSVIERDSIVFVEVADDGSGFDASAANGGGFGLVGMRERVSLAGGRLELESRPGEGTAVRAVLPAALVSPPSTAVTTPPV